MAWLFALTLSECVIGQLFPEVALISAGFGVFLWFTVLAKFSLRIRRMLWSWTPIHSLPPFTFVEWLTGASGMALFLAMIATFALLAVQHAA